MNVEQVEELAGRMPFLNIQVLPKNPSSVFLYIDAYSIGTRIMK